MTPKKKFPIVGFIAWWLLLDRLNAPAMLIGAYWAVVVVVCVGTVAENMKK